MTFILIGIVLDVNEHHISILDELTCSEQNEVFG